MSKDNALPSWQGTEQAEKYRSPFMSPEEASASRTFVSGGHREWHYYRDYYAALGRRALAEGWSPDTQRGAEQRTMAQMLSHVTLDCPPSAKPPEPPPARFGARVPPPPAGHVREYPTPQPVAVLAGLIIAVVISTVMVLPFDLLQGGSAWAQLSSFAAFPLCWWYCAHFIRTRRWERN